MKFKNFKPFLKLNLQQIPGWRTNRKILIIESDDWGGIRMPSAKTYKLLSERCLRLNGHYNKFDSLERAADLSSLFDVLSAYKDNNGNHPIITANFLVANPDFEKIKACNLETYFYELFTETYKKYNGCESSFSLLQQGMSENIFKPQFHGREHLNVSHWMKALQTQHSETMFAFEHKFWGFAPNIPDVGSRHFLSAYYIESLDELTALNKIIDDGLKIFESTFNYKSQSFVATNYTWHPGIEKTLSDNGVRYIKGQRIQLVPKFDQKGYHKKWRYTGQKNILGQLHLVRNVNFEPSENSSKDWVSSCKYEISNAFYWKKPAILSSHRVNFIGAIEPKNSSKNLMLLKKLLNEIVKSWPDIEFMTSDSLGKTILKNEI